MYSMASLVFVLQDVSSADQVTVLFRFRSMRGVYSLCSTSAIVTRAADFCGDCGMIRVLGFDGMTVMYQGF